MHLTADLLYTAASHQHGQVGEGEGGGVAAERKLAGIEEAEIVMLLDRFFSIYIYIYVCMYMYICTYIYVCSESPPSTVPLNMRGNLLGRYVYMYICIYASIDI